MLVLLSCGGHARSVADVALTAGFEPLCFVDEQARDGEISLGVPVQRGLPPHTSGLVYMPCAGNNQRRLEQIRQLTEAGLPLASVISPRASIGHGAVVSPGCFVGHHAHIGPQARIGAGCIVNTAAVVEHDCVLGECCHVSVHSSVAGRSRLGEGVFVGAGAVVIDNVSVADGVIVGAGGVVVADIEEPGTYVGVPVRKVGDVSFESLSCESEFVRVAVATLEQLCGRIEVCVGKLTPDQVWGRGGENQNAIGNLLLHLSGNVRQWILSAVGGAKDIRERDQEFSARGSIDPAELVARLKATVQEAEEVIRRLSGNQLMERISVQGYHVTKLEAVFHVVEHFSGHTFQIIFATKLLTGGDLGFYAHLASK
jgi:sugar O-acyltransferase (sialic acid O-acetyltransferase NeuD family)